MTVVKGKQPTRFIYKYPLKITEVQEVNLPEGACLASIQCQDNQLYLWALVDPNKPIKPRLVRIWGTGHPINETDGLDMFIYQATVQVDVFVWHVFVDKRVSSLGV